MKNNPVTDWLDAIWESDLPTNAKVIAAYLRRHLHKVKYTCFPSINTIANGCSLGKTSVHKYLNLLIRARWIDKKKVQKAEVTRTAYCLKMLMVRDTNIIVRLVMYMVRLAN